MWKFPCLTFQPSLTEHWSLVIFLFWSGTKCIVVILIFLVIFSHTFFNVVLKEDLLIGLSALCWTISINDWTWPCPWSSVSPPPSPRPASCISCVSLSQSEQQIIKGKVWRSAVNLTWSKASFLSFSCSIISSLESPCSSLVSPPATTLALLCLSEMLIVISYRYWRHWIEHL